MLASQWKICWCSVPTKLHVRIKQKSQPNWWAYHKIIAYSRFLVWKNEEPGKDEEMCFLQKSYWNKYHLKHITHTHPSVETIQLTSLCSDMYAVEYYKTYNSVSKPDSKPFSFISFFSVLLREFFTLHTFVFVHVCWRAYFCLVVRLRNDKHDFKKPRILLFFFFFFKSQAQQRFGIILYIN